MMWCVSFTWLVWGWLWTFFFCWWGLPFIRPMGHIVAGQLRPICSAAHVVKTLDQERRPTTFQTFASTRSLHCTPSDDSLNCPHAQLHSHAPLGQPALECHSWGRISLQALNMSHVSLRKRGSLREVWQVCAFTRQWQVGCHAFVCVCLRVKDCQIKGLKGSD